MSTCRDPDVHIFVSVTHQPSLGCVCVVVPDPFEYISFYGLRTHDELLDNLVSVTLHTSTLREASTSDLNVFCYQTDLMPTILANTAIFSGYLFPM